MLRLRPNPISVNATNKEFTKLEGMKNTALFKFIFYLTNYKPLLSEVNMYEQLSVMPMRDL